MQTPFLTLITGGVRSGKSRWAFETARSLPEKKAFLATAEAFDESMRSRIQNHQRERGAEFTTFEEPLYLGKALSGIRGKFEVVLIDCMTVWLGNLFYRFETAPEKRQQEIQGFLETLNPKQTRVFIVTNETGSGVMPENALARRYVDELGALNQQLAQLADEVIWMVCGIPQVIKKNALVAS